MLRRLLAERFMLILRTEQREMQVFKLVVAPTGSKLTRSLISEAECSAPKAPNACHDLAGSSSRGASGSAVSLDDLASLLEASSVAPVVNATGLEGLFSVKLAPYSRVTPLLIPDAIANLPADRRPAEQSFPSASKVLEQDLFRSPAGIRTVIMSRCSSSICSIPT